MAKHSGMKGSYLLIDFWRRCYYCTYFVHNPYLHDPDGRAFCDWCFDYLCVDDGIPEDADHWWCDKQCGSGSSTEHYEEGKPPRIPIIEVAFGNGKWWSIPQQMSAELYAKFEAGQDAVYTWDWGDSRKGSWKPDDEETSINRYMIDFVHKQQRNIDNGRMRTIRLIWILEEDAMPQWTGQIPR